jgi:hypothetical protein
MERRRGEVPRCERQRTHWVGIDGNVCVVVGRRGWVRVDGVSVLLHAQGDVSINVRGGINIQRGLTEA